LTQRACPICLSTNYKTIFDEVIADFDGTAFDTLVLIVCCKDCGFAYNIPDVSSSCLEEHYQQEALYQTETGFGVGGTTPADLARYARYYSLLEHYVTPNDKAVVDIGCSKGGLLAFLRTKGLSNLRGIELDSICADYARKTHGLQILCGSANSVPLPDKSTDILIYSHVLEHVDDPAHVLAEALRILKDDGVILIEVPNALRYADAKMFDYFHWFGMREHINHFDAVHLSMLLENSGFETLVCNETIVSPNKSQITADSNRTFPMLAGVFKKKTDKTTAAKTKQNNLRIALERYLSAEANIIDLNKTKLTSLIDSGKPVYVWGIALEFFCLYSFGGLKKCNIHSLVDKSVFKQTKTVNGLRVVSPETLRSVTLDASVVISSSFHADEMQEYLKEIAFAGEIIVFR
jgi:SAM-dependent methyltransferase